MAPQRFFIDKLGLESTAVGGVKASNAPELWTDHKSFSSLALKSEDEIANYVMATCRDYFRLTKKAQLTPNSTFKDHGLDSLDVIELVI